MPTRKRSGSSKDDAAPDAAAPVEESVTTPAKTTRPRKTTRARATAAPKAAVDPALPPIEAVVEEPAAEPAPVKKTTRRRTTKKAAAAAEPVLEAPEAAPEAPAEPVAEVAEPAAPAPRKRTRRAATRAAAPPDQLPDELPVEAEVTPAEPVVTPPAELTLVPELPATFDEPAAPRTSRTRPPRKAALAPPMALFVAPTMLPELLPVEPQPEPAAIEAPAEEDETAAEESTTEATTDESGDDDGSAESRRRRRGRRGRGRGRGGPDDTADVADDETEAVQPQAAKPQVTAEAPAEEETEDSDDAAAEGTSGDATRRRRRRRRRGGAEGDDHTDDDSVVTAVHVRAPRQETEKQPVEDDGVRGVKGSTRLEAKRQRRRDGRDQGRRRPPVLTEAEFLARREAVERTMVVRQRGERTQIAVLEDGVLVEHYVTKASSTSYAGNVYLGRVQNVLPSMEAAFVDIGKGRNAVLYAGEVNWDLAGMDGKPRKIEQALKSGDSVLVQVTKDPVGHKGARLTSQVSLPGRFLVYVPENEMTGISRKLPDTERKRLKAILKKVVPENAGVIVRTAAEGASEDELRRDVARLEAQWQAIVKAQAAASSNAPTLLYGEPDLVIRVIRDIFNEDFASLVVSGDGGKDDAWETVREYVGHVSPDLVERLSHHTGEKDVFTEYRVDEQLAKALDRKVWLPSGGSLVIDRTEAMTVIDVNTGRFTGQGGNLEETVTRNNLEAAEEIVRQLRLRDIGGMIVVDFIDMVLESNRELVLRRLTECLGRDRTKHQVAEVTSLGLVQMTRKRVGQGLLEAFSETCEHCHGRGLIIHTEPIEHHHGGGGQQQEKQQQRQPEESSGGRRKRNRGRNGAGQQAEESSNGVVEADELSVDDGAGAAVVAEAVEDAEPVSAAPAAVAEPVAEPVTEPEPEVEAPVVQGTRPRRARRAASRPAGPPPVAVGS
jgi:ribonuclease E